MINTKYSGTQTKNSKKYDFSLGMTDFSLGKTVFSL